MRDLTDEERDMALDAERDMDAFHCPKCKSTDCFRDEVDIGVGIQYGPWHCNSCGWFELGAEDILFPLNEDEVDDAFNSDSAISATDRKG